MTADPFPIPAELDPYLDPIIRDALRDVDPVTSTARPLAPSLVVTVLNRVVHQAYAAGRHAALTELRTTEEVAAELQVTTSQVRRLARRYGVGTEVGGGQRLFLAADVVALRARKTQPGPAKRTRAAVS